MVPAVDPVSQNSSAVNTPAGAHDDVGFLGDDAHWSLDELASMSSLRGSGRVLTLRVGHAADAVDHCLRQAGYRVGRLAVTRESSHLPQAAASFLPDTIYVTLDDPIDACIDALEALACDPRTSDLPIVALLPREIPDGVIEEAYARSGCDFLRLGGSHVELLARTHLLVRLSTRALGLGTRPLGPPERSEAANDEAAGTRLDLRDGATGVYSVMYFRHRLQQEVARAHRYQRPLTLLAVRCPAAARDDAASRLASVLADACRNVDLVARIEPDLFAVLLPETVIERGGPVVERILGEAAAAGMPCRIGTAGLGAPGDDAAYSAGSLLRLACGRADE
jgi:PleD family two-component response regulator